MANSSYSVFTFFFVLALPAVSQPVAASDTSLSDLCSQFQTYSGARLVFERSALTPGRYYDRLDPLDRKESLEAAAICLEAVRKYPPRYLSEIGLEVVGVFAACVSNANDGYRAFDRQLNGYRYFGVYNGNDAVVAAFYDTQQLPLTLHHEIFHHVDSTEGGQTESWLLSSDDARFHSAITGWRTYPAPKICPTDLAALRLRCKGFVLQDTVNEYSGKNAREDQAETARYLMDRLPDAIVQAVDHPELPGSQRIIHVLHEYAHAVPSGPELDWFVNVALERNTFGPHRLIARIQEYTNSNAASKKIRRVLKYLTWVDPHLVTEELAMQMSRGARDASRQLLFERLRPDPQQSRFSVWGPDDSQGVNWTLRRDLDRFAVDSIRLGRIAAYEGDSEEIRNAQLQHLGLIARYYCYIAKNWSMTAGTERAFQETRDAMIGSMPTTNQELTRWLTESSLRELAQGVSRDGANIEI